MGMQSHFVGDATHVIPLASRGVGLNPLHELSVAVAAEEGMYPDDEYHQ